MGGIAGLAGGICGDAYAVDAGVSGGANVPIAASPSLEVIGFAFGVSLVTGILFGVAPAWIAAQAKPADALASGTRTRLRGASLLQRGLVVLQAALSLVLLVGAGLFAQNLNKLQSMDLKLDAKNRYIVHINPQAAGYSQTQLEALYRTMEERFHAVPGVVKVGISNYTPMEDNNWGNGIGCRGSRRRMWRFLHQGQCGVLRLGGNAGGDGARDWRAGYFDGSGGAVVNQTFVKKFFKREESDRAAIGRRFAWEILRLWAWWRIRLIPMCAGRITACTSCR
jgi:macrolide transport system ATP-binding/permease protein